MSGQELSKAVADAARFLQEIHADTRALLGSIETALVSAGWKSIAKKLTDWNLNATLQGNWMLWWFYRMYVPHDSSDQFKRLVLISGCFGADPGESAGLIASAIRFPHATNHGEVWDNWENNDGVSAAASKQTGVAVLSASDYAEYTPAASAVAAIRFPLCELTSDAAVRARLVNPILAAEAKLGAKP